MSVYPGHIRITKRVKKVSDNCSSVHRVKKTASCKISKNIKQHA